MGRENRRSGNRQHKEIWEHHAWTALANTDPEGPAAKAGIYGANISEVGDEFIQYDGHRYPNAVQLERYVYNTDPGPVIVKVRHHGASYYVGPARTVTVDVLSVEQHKRLVEAARQRSVRRAIHRRAKAL